MVFHLDGTGKVLANTPQVLQSLLHGLPEQLVRANYGSGTWFPHEVVGHLIHGEKPVRQSRQTSSTDVHKLLKEVNL
jgi:hypothetical protein